MNDKLGGQSLGVSVLLGGKYVFSDASIIGISIKNTINALPSGTLKLSVADISKFDVSSGSYGILFLSDDTMPNGKVAYSIYLKSISIDSVTEYTGVADIIWKMGTPLTMARSTIAYTGTSIDAAVESIKAATGGNLGTRSNVDPAVMSSNTDSMVWRIVNSDLEESLQYIVGHSYIPGDYLVWTFDDLNGDIVLTTFNYINRTALTNYAIWDINAVNTTGAARITDTSTGTTVWTYLNDARSDQTGNAREDVFPNIVVSTVTDGKCDISNCKEDCFGKLSSQSGGKSVSENKDTFGLDNNEHATYGDIQLTEHFSMNTHPMFYIAPQLRRGTMAGYTKQMDIVLENELGPSVGTAIAVCAYGLNKESGNTTPDLTYSDTYIVIGKEVTRNSGASKGLLGVETGDNNPTLRTILKLASAHTGTKSSLAGAAVALGNITKILSNISKK